MKGDFPTFSPISAQWSEISQNGLLNFGHFPSLRYGEKWCTLVHHEIPDGGSFAPTLWAKVFQLDKAASNSSSSLDIRQYHT